MRRRLFFWLDKLKITRTERQAISILLIIFTVLLLLNATISPSSPFNDEYYSELDARFRMRTALMQQEEQQILSRYRGEQVSITSTDTLAPDSTAGQAFAEIPKSALIHINTADASALQQLRGIGAAYAQRIIEYRQLNGPFQSADELLDVKGIGEVRLQKIAPFITLGKGDAPDVSSRNDALPEQQAETDVEEKKEARAEVKDDQLRAEVQKKDRDKDEIDTKIKVEKTRNKIEFEDEVKVQAKVEKAPFTINVNNANAEVLQQLSGIGPTYARRIVEYRKLNGPFETKEQLLDIKGIGKKRLAKIKPFVKLTDQH